MSTLVGYGSSDEDEAPTPGEASTGHLKTLPDHILQGSRPKSNDEINGGNADMPDAAPPGANALSELAAEGDMEGPVAGPSVQYLNSGPGSVPTSPYSAGRSLIRDLTLPTVPNLDIPESPPASPPPGLEKKLEHFLELKKQGIHFNEKLAKSSALKNPSLMGKLMRFAGLEDGDEYATSLPKELWDPMGFPAWAYKDELAKAQVEAQKQRDEEQSKTQRDHIDFVSASSGIGAGKGLKGSASERVMAGLDRDRSNSRRRSRSR